MVSSVNNVQLMRNARMSCAEGMSDIVKDVDLCVADSMNGYNIRLNGISLRRGQNFPSDIVLFDG